MPRLSRSVTCTIKKVGRRLPELPSQLTTHNGADGTFTISHVPTSGLVISLIKHIGELSIESASLYNYTMF